MIKLNSVNKYYNKNRSNENHIIKNTSIEFPDKGLVVLLGASGSGKTTLLNVISGMDKFSKGKINIADYEITKYKAKVWDDIRNNYIGYIFQNYNLLKDLTVYENIELVLKMNGITSHEEIDKRISYLLGSVGILNFQDRRADQLSGGQQQRVAFARALAKNPKVIIADEPTGNLDSKTTIEIMNIIKKISQDKLVIMVTHEQELADFYADRIIEVVNGHIVRDSVNEYQGNLSVIQEHIIYLKDLESNVLSNDDVDVITYSDQEAEKLEKVGVQLIMRNNTLFIKVNTKHYRRVKYIDNESEIELIDDHFKNAKDEKISGFDYEHIIEEPEFKKKKSVVTIKDSFKYAIRKMNKLSTGGKMLYVVLGLVGAVISVSIGLIGHIYNIDDSSFVDKPRNFIKITTGDMTYEEVKALEDLSFIRDTSFILEPYLFSFDTEKYYEVKSSIEVTGYPVNIELLSPSNIIYGVYPEEGYGVVIDASLADELIKKYAERGVESYKDILDVSVKLQTSGSDFDLSDETSINFPIVGISNDNSPTIWMKKELIYSLVLPTLADYQILGDGFELVSGEMPYWYRDVLLSEESTLIRQGNVPSSVGIQTGLFDVTGTYRYIENGVEYNTNLLMITNFEALEKVYFYKYQFALVNYNFLAFVDDPEDAIYQLKHMGYNARSEYNDDYDMFSSFEFEKNAGYLAIAVVGIFVSAISIYFIMRSSLISRIYEVSVYRALGASKNDIRKMFVIEVLLTTTISSIVGFFITMILLLQAQSQVVEYVEIVYYGVQYVFFGVVGIYIINSFFGLLPINILLRKTPSEILTKFDL